MDTTQKRRKYPEVFALIALVAAAWILIKLPIGRPKLAIIAQSLVGEPTGEPQLISVESMAPVEGQMCQWTDLRPVAALPYERLSPWRLAPPIPFPGCKRTTRPGSGEGDPRYVPNLQRDCRGHPLQ